MQKKSPWQPVSIHGGHSGQFCNHARDNLEEVIGAYIEKGFAWVGITEHMPPVSDDYLFPDEVAAGLTAVKLHRRFAAYVETCRQLQQQYATRIEILVGFESETYTGSVDLVTSLLERFDFDYFVGSVHHVDDVVIDYDAALYERLARKLGGLEALYCRYFDLQYEMIATLKPPVVGHFDLIRIFDPDYVTTLARPYVRQRIERNLEAIRSMDLILDLNLRALAKGAMEPYLSTPILERAIGMGIPVVPGDDSHGVADVGANLRKAAELITKLGGSTDWCKPATPQGPL